MRRNLNRVLLRFNLEIQMNSRSVGRRRLADKLLNANASSPNRLASKSGRDRSIAINQDTDLFVAKLDGGETVSHSLLPNRHAWLHVAEGELTVNAQKLTAGDGVAVSEQHELKLTASKPSQMLLFDLI